ncbi:glycerophosphodiester phosphodiesterase family protein [Paenibacillus sacheonensis]|uniref:Glycerophosphodiester phosphodiesterase n=1 Tax=Paenibacillus sacheonensis TaxID=742054 RepID=A0A7X5BXH2_9BACL|nr:glycerophosphoryl diester phosphodiesterase [Paenibacillus sacheonensis]NBC68401.1 glycerophosphodiester phosphodiesterase [Paenibacillus sacheonensis]
MDVHVARGGTPVLLHDDSPYLREYCYEQLNDLAVRTLLSPAYAEHEIVTLEQLLRVSEWMNMLLNLDLKSAAAIEPAAELVRRFGAQNRIFFTGTTDSMTERFPDINVMFNTPDALHLGQRQRYDEFADAVCREAQLGGYRGLNMEASTCRQVVVDRAHAAGLLVWAYTVNERSEMERLLAMGVDAITTRKPERLLKIIEASKNV